ncbi:hypothetical protein FDECE_11834 [Fusarium decemcellulare]|nr:hypothetical protein FDECE_11834 [Fusarium decemcellulare]
MSGEEGRPDTNASAREIFKETDHPTGTVLKETNHPNGVALAKHDQSMGTVLTGADHPTGTVLPKTDRSTETVLTEQDGPVEADANPPEDDGDSAFGSEPASSATSIASSILEYRTIHGRRYHSDRGDAAYWAPNDYKQKESMANKEVFQGRLEDSLEIKDCTHTWTFDDNSIDYTHMRYLIGSIKDWPSLMKQAFRVCKPGGYVESYKGSPDIESNDDTVPEGSAMADWGPIFKKAGVKIGRPFTVLHEDLARGTMKEAEFVDIESRDFKI